MFSLESPYRDDSNEYTQYTIFNIIKKITLIDPKSAVMGFFQGTQERVFEPQKFYSITNNQMRCFHSSIYRCLFSVLLFSLGKLVCFGAVRADS